VLKKYFTIFGLILLFGCNSGHDENVVFDFIVNETECNKNIIFGKTELESSWTKNILTVKKTVAINSCNSKILNGNYKINDSQIRLEYEISPCGQFCCDSDSCQELTFQFEGLEKKDYEFELGKN